MAQFYQVGGSVRDEILGVKSKDIDYCVVAPSYEAMRTAIVERGGTIFLETPQYLTIRAKVPKLGACDYVLARKEGAYSDGRHPDKVEPGTLYDDLARRDFTINAIAKGEAGGYIDYFGGIDDINNKLIRCVGNPLTRFEEDYLRIFRALRFSICKGMMIGVDTCLAIIATLRDVDIVEKISIERIYEELRKMFAHDTMGAIDLLREYNLLNLVFQHPKIKLMPVLN
jgi:tRNA nucleotidyltransferase (CCA-adding enzyme)